MEFGTIAACDGVAQGHEGMHYILPSREIICDSVEIMAQAHRLDGLVLLASCDKTTVSKSRHFHLLYVRRLLLYLS